MCKVNFLWIIILSSFAQASPTSKRAKINMTFEQLVRDPQECCVTTLQEYVPVIPSQKSITCITSSLSDEKSYSAYIITRVDEGESFGTITNLAFIKREHKRKYNESETYAL